MHIRLKYSPPPHVFKKLAEPRLRVTRRTHARYFPCDRIDHVELLFFHGSPQAGNMLVELFQSVEILLSIYFFPIAGGWRNVLFRILYTFLHLSKIQLSDIILLQGHIDSYIAKGFKNFMHVMPVKIGPRLCIRSKGNGT